LLPAGQKDFFMRDMYMVRRVPQFTVL